jgi:acyl carrier protein
MNRENVLSRLRAQMARTLEVDADDITEETRLVDDLDADSLDLLQLILGLKDQFGITINDGEVKQLLTELARFLPEKIGRGQQLSDEELGEVSRRLTVGSIVDFILDRSAAAA